MTYTKTFPIPWGCEHTWKSCKKQKEVRHVDGKLSKHLTTCVKYTELLGFYAQELKPASSKRAFFFLEKCGVIFKNGCFFGVRMSNTRCENSAQVFCDMVLSIVCGEGKMKYTENGWKKCWCNKFRKNCLNFMDWKHGIVIITHKSPIQRVYSSSLCFIKLDNVLPPLVQRCALSIYLKIGQVTLNVRVQLLYCVFVLKWLTLLFLGVSPLPNINCHLYIQVYRM